jgi:hypothetical protein
MEIWNSVVLLSQTPHPLLMRFSERRTGELDGKMTLSANFAVLSLSRIVHLLAKRAIEVGDAPRQEGMVGCLPITVSG